MIHETANIYKTAKLGVNVKVGAFSEVGHNVRIHDNVSIGYGVFVPENVEIMKNTFVGPGTVFTNDKYAPSKGKWREEPPTIVGTGVSIGANCTILPNLTIGDGAVIGAGSVVTRNVEPNTTVYGNPAKVVR